jgi:hypothetical protein
MALIVEKGVPIIETRGRPPSEEHVTLLTMPVGESFVSPKSRESLYQIARSLGIQVSVMSEGDGRWRVWKKGKPGEKRKKKEKKGKNEKAKE